MGQKKKPSLKEGYQTFWLIMDINYWSVIILVFKFIDWNLFFKVFRKKTLSEISC